MSDIAARQQQNLLQQPTNPATETALEGAQEPSKTLDWEPAQDVYLLWSFFHFSDEAVKGARRRRGKPGLDQYMRSNLEATMRASGRPR